jgi:hypothetical protein
MADDPKQEKEGDKKAEQAEKTEQTAKADHAEQTAPSEAFKQGVELLWQAARGAVGGLRQEIRKADIVGGLREAAEEMKRAADAAIHGKPREPEPQDVHAAEAAEPADAPKGARIDTEGEKPSGDKPPEGKSSGS